MLAVASGQCILELLRDGHSSPAEAIALDDAIGVSVASGISPPTLRIWVNNRALVLPAWRLCGSAAGTVMDGFGQTWPICGRSSGGAAVAHGPGTLNMSLVLPMRGRSQPSIDASYRLWIGLLSAALSDQFGIAVNAAEVEGAFCSGRYDASVDGRKLAGVSQARRKGTVLVHGTILVEVDRARYLQVIEAGERWLGIASAPRSYDAERMVSLHELVRRPVGLQELANSVIQAAARVLEWR